MKKQPEIRIINDFQTLRIIQNGTLVILEDEDPSFCPTYHSVIIDGELAHTASIATGRTIYKNPGLMIAFDAVIETISND